MAKSFRKLTENFSDARKARIAEQAKALLVEYEVLSELRKDKELTQQEVANILNVRQNTVSKMENQHDILVRTLARYVDALGGQLEITARFDDEVVTLHQFTR